MSSLQVRPVELLDFPMNAMRIRPKTAGGYVQECNVVYAETDGIGLVMDVFRPEGPANGLGIIDVVSHGWHSGRLYMNEHAGIGVMDVFCRRGFAVFAVCPGTVTKFTGLDMHRHVRAAIRFVKAHGERYGVDPARLGITGISAGASLAAMAAVSNKVNAPVTARRVEAAALFFPPTDLVAHGIKHTEEPEVRGCPERLLFECGLLGRTDEEIAAQLEAISPLRHIGCAPPPVLLFHGTADEIVSHQQSVRFAAALRAAGCEVELVLKEGYRHSWPDKRPELRQAAEWFEQVLGR